MNLISQILTWPHRTLNSFLSVMEREDYLDKALEELEQNGTQILSVDENEKNTILIAYEPWCDKINKKLISIRRLDTGKGLVDVKVYIAQFWRCELVWTEMHWHHNPPTQAHAQEADSFTPSQNALSGSPS